MQAARQAMFARLDTNKDKVVTRDELAAGHERSKEHAGKHDRGHCRDK